MGEDENPNRDKVIEDHVLCAIFGWLEGGAKEDVKRLTTSVFQFEELKNAMIKFCDPDIVIGNTKHKNHQKCETSFDEIWSQWDMLNKTKNLPRAVVDSLNFIKLPLVRPGETRTEVSSERIAALERMIDNLIEQNKVIVDSLEQIKKKEAAPVTFASKAAAATGPKTGSGLGTSGGGHAGNAGHGNHLGPQHQERGRLHSLNRLQARDRSQTPSKRQRTDEDIEQNVPAHEQQGWEDVNRRRYRSNGVKVIRCTAGVASVGVSGGAGVVRQGWKSSPREIFVYHTHHSTTEDDMRDLVNETSMVEVLEIEMLEIL